MKVQHRRLHSFPPVQWEVMEESPHFYVCQMNGTHAALPKDSWEPVPEWVDVTHECSIHDDGHLWQAIYHHDRWIGDSKHAYRLRMVYDDARAKRWLIVERKVA